MRQAERVRCPIAQVRFSKRGRIDHCVEIEPVCLVGVENRMLEEAYDTLLLSPNYHPCVHQPRQQGVFREVLEVPAVAYLANKIDAAVNDLFAFVNGRKQNRILIAAWLEGTFQSALHFLCLSCSASSVP